MLCIDFMKINIGSGNGLMQQAITWVNVDPDLCHHMATGPQGAKYVAMYAFSCDQAALRTPLS